MNKLILSGLTFICVASFSGYCMADEPAKDPGKTAPKAEMTEKTKALEPVTIQKPAAAKIPAVSSQVASHLNAADNFGRNKQYHEAIHEYDQAIALNPKFGPAYYGRGICFQLLSLNDKASDNYKKAIEFDPENPSPYNNLGTLYYSEKKYDQALVYLKKASELWSKQGNFVRATNLKPIIDAIEALQ
jgi:Flp pilus assembly protein TadD